MRLGIFKIVLIISILWIIFFLPASYCQDSEMFFLIEEGKIKYLFFDYTDDNPLADELLIIETEKDSQRRWYENEYIKKVLDKNNESIEKPDKNKTLKDQTDVYKILEVYEKEEGKKDFLIRKDIYNEGEESIFIIEKD